MHQQCHADNRLNLWKVFEGRLLKPSQDSSQPVSYDDLAEQLGVASPDQLPNLLVTAKQMFNRNVRETIADYVGDDQVDQEIFDLREALSRAAPR